MKYDLLVRPEAEADIKESFDWYEDELPGLGHEFRLSLRLTISRICSNPQLFPFVHRHIRRALVRRFPHAFYFFVADEKVIVTACVHHKRDPKIWKKRRQQHYLSVPNKKLNKSYAKRQKEIEQNRQGGSEITCGFKIAGCDARDARDNARSGVSRDTDDAENRYG